MPLEPGQAAEVERVVTRELTADALGARFLERAAAKATRAKGPSRAS